MRCPYCGRDEDRVVDSRPVEDGAAIRRRRECTVCDRRFSTYERAEPVGPMVRKRGGVLEPFDPEKLLAGMQKATKNLPVAPEDVQRAAAQVEARIMTVSRRQVSSEAIGTEVLAALRELDPVAYVRFASVYKGFTSPEDFQREFASLEKDAPPKPR